MNSWCVRRVLVVALALSLEAPLARAAGPGGPGGPGEMLFSMRSAPAAAQSGLDPVLVPVAVVGNAGRPERSSEFDVAIVTVRAQGRTASDRVVGEIAAFLAARGLAVAPQERVSRAVHELGLLSPKALAPTDFGTLGTRVRARYVLVLSIREWKAAKEFTLGTSILSLGRLAFLGAIFRGRHDQPWLLGVGLAGLLVAGITTRATCDLAAQVFDVRLGRTIWLDSASVTRKKVFLGLFSDKHELREQALEGAVQRLVGEVGATLAQRAASASPRAIVPGRALRPCPSLPGPRRPGD